ncbi:SHOCT domain-containing protein [Pararhodobacter zhoushanensis]|uniref:SHOCT domain-containing protein n=1 Tax=Pararhodobacter zhoushanensis TaxID=2479545 RepID=UPI000F8D7E01|nr:SHOCT domain-containing protein [Pararhodobacter zhoushanensis]
MAQLTQEGRSLVASIAARHGLSEAAVEHMLYAVAAGHGTQAQFNCPELGGMGQWSLGGMTMVGDMFNNGLKARVDALCSELSGIVRDHAIFGAPTSSQTQSQGGNYGTPGVSLYVQPAGNSWPSELGQPASVGTQNDMRYAWFPQARRLAIDVAGTMTLYDTGDHQISGFGQAQSGGQSLSFNSQYGLIDVPQLRVVDGAATPVADPVAEAPQQRWEPTPAPAQSPAPSAPTTQPESMSDDQIFSRIERLAGLFEKGILSQTEYETKKAELLARL